MHGKLVKIWSSRKQIVVRGKEGIGFGTGVVLSGRRVGSGRVGY